MKTNKVIVFFGLFTISNALSFFDLHEWISYKVRAKVYPIVKKICYIRFDICSLNTQNDIVSVKILVVWTFTLEIQKQ